MKQTTNMSPEMTIEQAYQIAINTFDTTHTNTAPDMIIDTPRGRQVSEAFVLYCKDIGLYQERLCTFII